MIKTWSDLIGRLEINQIQAVEKYNKLGEKYGSRFKLEISKLKIIRKLAGRDRPVPIFSSSAVATHK